MHSSSVLVAAVIAVLWSSSEAQHAWVPSYASPRLLQPSYSRAFSPAASSFVPKKWGSSKKASSNWALEEKLQRQQRLPDLSSQQSYGSEAAASYHSMPSGPESSHDGSRVQFHVQGHKGPKSYRFGYDTGKGKHRHFRYEERDAHGMVHGRYGFYDKHGKLQEFHYTAHPHHGYHAAPGGWNRNG